MATETLTDVSYPASGPHRTQPGRTGTVELQYLCNSSGAGLVLLPHPEGGTEVQIVGPPAFSPGIIELGSGTTARRYLIQSMRRTLRRGTPPIDAITAFEVTVGVRP